MRCRYLPLLALALLLPLAASPLRGTETGRLSGDLAVAGKAPITIEIPGGDLRLEGHDGDRLGVELTVDCSGDAEKCRQATSDLALASGTEAAEAVIWLRQDDAATGGESGEHRLAGPLRLLSLSGAPAAASGSWAWPSLTTPGRRLRLEMALRPPPGHPLEVRLGRGNVIATDLRSATTLRIERGRVRVLLPAEAVGSVRLQTREGFTELRRPGEAALQGTLLDGTIFGTRLVWQGEGTVDLDVELGDGDVVLQLH